LFAKKKRGKATFWGEKRKIQALVAQDRKNREEG